MSTIYRNWPTLTVLQLRYDVLHSGNDQWRLSSIGGGRMNKSRFDQEESIFSKAEMDKLYGEFANIVRNGGFNTQQQKDDVVKNEMEKLTKLVRRKKMNLRII